MASKALAPPYNHSSWPGLSRPSTRICRAREFVDGRIKSGHDEGGKAQEDRERFT